jgi:hypothetical protein
VLAWARPAAAQEQLGNKMLGTIGLGAGSVPRSGLYLLGQLFSYGADTLVDRNGHALPFDPALRIRAAMLGVGASFDVPAIGTSIGASVGLPFVHVTAATQRAEASIDRFGLGDLYAQPLKLGWKLGRAEIVVGYAFYAPTGRFEPGGKDGVGRGNFTHEPSLGGTLFFDARRRWHLSVLTSLDVNGRKRGIDITRGATVQAQGGLGCRALGAIDVGIAAYALWQVTDDGGSALPPALRGARAQDYGLGPEIDANIAPIRSRLTLRYEHDFAARSRPEGQILLFGLKVLAWDPAPGASPR